LTGGAFGAITSFYFTDQSYRARLAGLETQVKIAVAKVEGAETAWAVAFKEASSFKTSIEPYRKVFMSTEPVLHGDPFAVGVAKTLTKEQRKKLGEEFEYYYESAQAIETIGMKWVDFKG
jgi:hypothetical protein